MVGRNLVSTFQLSFTYFFLPFTQLVCSVVMRIMTSTFNYFLTINMVFISEVTANFRSLIDSSVFVILSNLVVSQFRCDFSGIMLIYTNFLKFTHGQFCCLIATNAFRSADLAEVNTDHQAIWDHVIGAPPYSR